MKERGSKRETCRLNLVSQSPRDFQASVFLSDWRDWTQLLFYFERCYDKHSHAVCPLLTLIFVLNFLFSIRRVAEEFLNLILQHHGGDRKQIFYRLNRLSNLHHICLAKYSSQKRCKLSVFIFKRTVGFLCLLVALIVLKQKQVAQNISKLCVSHSHCMNIHKTMYYTTALVKNSSKC